MQRNVGAWLILILTGVGLAASNWMRRSDPRELVDHAAVGNEILSELSLQSVTEPSNSLRGEDLRGHVVLISFWTTWCPNCMKELPQLNRVREQFGPSVKFIAICCETPSDKSLPQRVNEVIGRVAPGMPAYVGNSDWAKSAVTKAIKGQLTFPTVVVLDRNGVIRGVWEGYTPAAISQIEVTLRTSLHEES
jgi:thiol-disulfide isomerase/thioredoxin